MRSARHILIVNGRKVQQPVFIIGAPHSGAHLLARALKPSAASTSRSASPACCGWSTPSPGARRSTTAGRGRRDRDPGRVRAGLADHRRTAAWSAPECREAAGLGTSTGAVRDRTRPAAVRRRQPGPDLLRGGPHRRVPRRPDRPVHQGRPGRGGLHAARPGHPVLVQAELRQHRHRVPQPVLRRRDRSRTGTSGPTCRWPPSARCAGAGRSGWPPGCAAACRPNSSSRCATRR